MKKNKNEITAIISLTKELFTETIEQLKKQEAHDNKCSDAFKIILPSDYISSYNNDTIKQQLLRMLKVGMNDNHRDSWIDYFIYELEYGTKYKKGCASHKDDTNINLSDSSHLYDFLLKEMNSKN